MAYGGYYLLFCGWGFCFRDARFRHYDVIDGVFWQFQPLTRAPVIQESRPQSFVIHRGRPSFVEWFFCVE